VLEVLARRIDVIGHEGAPVADVIGSGRQHEVIDGELASAGKEIGQRQRPGGSFEDIGLLDRDPRETPALGPERVEFARQLLFPGQELPAGG
jgi:hypothetical protein